MTRPATEPLNDEHPDGVHSVRVCAHPGCTEPGVHRAPVSRDRLNDYLWFCLEHVREYNLAWDYFRNMSEDEIEAVRRGDTVWQRPSWPFRTSYHQAEAEIHEKMRGDFGTGKSGANGASGKGRRSGGARQGERPGSKHPQSETAKALEALGLEATASFTEAKSRYKTLAKKLHPDANGGDSRAEERLKVINQAYATLKKAFSS